VSRDLTDAGRTVDINADAGESFGRWQLGADEELAPLISSINVACGWHAGDPAAMTRAVRLAREHGIALGAHPGFPDLVGFGRRMISFSPDEAAQAVLYQFGALRALADAEGVRVAHVKPHGSLYGLVSRDDDVADAVADAVGAAAPEVHLLLEAGHTAQRQAERGHRVVAEGFADLEYTDEARIIIDPQNQRRDPQWCAQQTADILSGSVRSVNNREVTIRAASICLHSDRPGAGDNARAVIERVRAEGYAVAAPTFEEGR
jgi:5-oxoprolinase (ATP-hydrolysing) subunit A